jgi:two-component system sensor histidine kinase BaeS
MPRTPFVQSNQMNRPPLAPSVAALALLLAILTPALLLLRTVDEAVTVFRRAEISRSQFADVMALQNAMRGGGEAALPDAIARYRAGIDAEIAQVGRDTPPEQRDEIAEAREMAVLATRRPLDIPRITRLIAAASARERDEAAAMATAIEDLRTRSRRYALALAAIAIFAAVGGAAGLVTANRRLASAVTDRTRRLVAIDASRRLFFAKISHELRSPITVLRGEAEVALATAARDPSALTAALEEVVVQSEQLDRRVGELLALSKADDGALELNSASIDLSVLTQRAMAAAERFARSNGVRLTANTLDPLYAIGDARWLEQAIVAIIDNAVKFSTNGDIVEVSLVRRGDHAILSVADRGLGVSPDALPRLFDAYYQGAEGRARVGTGLGLALVRWVSERHGGTAAIAQRDGGGCVVTLTLPVAA